MKLRCLLFGHSYKPLGKGVDFDRQKKSSVYEPDGLREYKCTRCGKVVVQEEYYS